jgi:hypothetical protein
LPVISASYAGSISRRVVAQADPGIKRDLNIKKRTTSRQKGLEVWLKV